MTSLTLFQYEICPFCSKIKGLLDFNRIPYRTVEVNPLTKAELRKAEFRQMKVPFAVFPEGSKISDSPVIIQELYNRGLFGARGPNNIEWQRWETFADKKLAVLLFPNITRNLPEGWQAFSYIQDAPNLTLVDKALNRVLGTFAMVAANPRLKRKYNIADERSALAQVLQEWTGAMQGEVFHGGRAPDNIDAMIFGVLRAVDGLDAHRWILANVDPRLSVWYSSMSTIVGTAHSSRIERI